VQLGAAIVTAAVRRIGLGAKLSSGRTRVDLEAALDSLAEPGYLDDDPVDPAPEPAEEQPPADAVAAILACAQRAPSGGNVQPWRLRGDTELIEITLDPTAATAMDVRLRGSAVAVRAALHNARVAAAAHGLLGEPELRVDGAADPPAARLPLRAGRDPARALGHGGARPALGRRRRAGERARRHLGGRAGRGRPAAGRQRPRPLPHSATARRALRRTALARRGSAHRHRRAHPRSGARRT